jgi:hypothetical protein
MASIEPQQPRCRSANGGHSKNHGRIAPEVIGPLVVPRVEQALQLARVGIDPGQIRTFQGITQLAREREIPEVVRAAVGDSEDVFDMKPAIRLVLLTKPAVFALVIRAEPYLTPKRRFHAPAASFFR